MSHQKCFLGLLLLTIGFASYVRPPQQQQTRVLFAVWPGQKGKPPDAPILDPIVLVANSEFHAPLDYGNSQGEEAEKLYAEFAKTYLAAGKTYPLLFGGSKLGNVEIVSAVGISCESLTATIKPSTSVPNGQKGLAATSIEEFGTHENWRQQNTPTQRADFMEKASDYFSKRLSARVVPSAITLRNLRLTRLNPAGPEVLIGSTTFKERSSAHHLFLVLERGENDWTVALASYHLTKDIEDYVDDVEEDFVDQIDLDGNGQDEIVTISSYYESWDYAIYKNRQGKWEKVYQGGGGGC